MAQVLTTSIVFMVIIALGYILKRVHFLKPDDYLLIARIVCNLTIPCAIISSFARLDFDNTLLLLIPIGMAANVVLIGIGYLFAVKKPKEQKSFQMINYSGFNFGSFTLPYLQSFCEPAAVVAACLVDAGNSLFCTGGTYAIAGAVMDRGETHRLRMFCKRIFSSAPVDVYLLMILLSLLQLRLPDALLTFTDTVSAGNSFLAMLMIGASLNLTVERKNVWPMVRLLLTRYTVCALMVGALWLCLPLNTQMRLAVCLVLLSPMASLDLVYTRLLGGDVALSSQATSLSIIISTALMTILLPLLSM